MNKVLLLHDNARPHTREAIATMGWTVLSHPPYSPELAHPEFHLFGPLKDALRGRRFAEDDELKRSVREELRRFSKEFFATGIQHLKQRCNSVLIMKKTFWKNNLNFVKDVPLIYMFDYNCNYSF
jgi:histone-lysine N-methyltransferase SETMAR